MSDDAGADEPVPKLPRGRGLKFSGPELFRILMTLVSLIGVVVLAKPCANSVSNFVMGYPQGSGARTNAPPTPGTVQPPPAPKDPTQYEQLRPGMSDEEIKAAIERSKAKNAAAQQGASGGVAPTGGSAGGAAPTGSATITPPTNTPPTNTPPTNTPPPPKANTAPTTMGSATGSAAPTTTGSTP